MIYVDANIPMYLVGEDHPNKRDARIAAERLAGERRRLVTSSEVFQEILHRFVAIGRREDIELAFETLHGLTEDILPVEEGDVFLAKDLLHSHPQLSARDALHLGVMRRHEIAEIFSFDRGFDAISGIARLPRPANA